MHSCSNHLNNYGDAPWETNGEGHVAPNCSRVGNYVVLPCHRQLLYLLTYSALVLRCTRCTAGRTRACWSSAGDPETTRPLFPHLDLGNPSWRAVAARPLRPAPRRSSRCRPSTSTQRSRAPHGAALPRAHLLRRRFLQARTAARFLPLRRPPLYRRRPSLSAAATPSFCCTRLLAGALRPAPPRPNLQGPLQRHRRDEGGDHGEGGGARPDGGGCHPPPRQELISSVLIFVLVGFYHLNLGRRTH